MRRRMVLLADKSLLNSGQSPSTSSMYNGEGFPKIMWLDLLKFTSLLQEKPGQCRPCQAPNRRDQAKIGIKPGW